MTTNPKIPAWINIDEIVDPALKERAEELGQYFSDLYDSIFPKARDAMTLLKQLAKSVAEDCVDDIMRDADFHERDEVSTGLWHLFQELNGYAAIDRPIDALANLFDIMRDVETPAFQELEAEEVSK